MVVGGVVGGLTEWRVVRLPFFKKVPFWGKIGKRSRKRSVTIFRGSGKENETIMVQETFFSFLFQNFFVKS